MITAIITLIHRLRSRFASKATSAPAYSYVYRGSAINFTAASFAENVALICAIHDLDPELPEIKQLMLEARGIVRNPRDAIRILRALNPEHNVSRHGNTYYLGERIPGLQLIILSPLSLLRHHVRDFDQNLTRIVVDATGLHTYDYTGMQTATVAAAAIDPTQFTPDSRRECNTAVLLEQITGLPLKELAQIIIAQEPNQPPISSLTIEREPGQGWDIKQITTTTLLNTSE